MKLDAISEKEEDENYDMVTAHNSVKGSVKGKKGFGFSIKKLSPAAKKEDDQSEFLKRVFEGVTETDQERKRTRPLTLYNNKLDESYGEIERVPEKRLHARAALQKVQHQLQRRELQRHSQRQGK